MQSIERGEEVEEKLSSRPLESTSHRVIVVGIILAAAKQKDERERGKFILTERSHTCSPSSRRTLEKLFTIIKISLYFIWAMSELLSSSQRYEGVWRRKKMKLRFVFTDSILSRPLHRGLAFLIFCAAAATCLTLSPRVCMWMRFSECLASCGAEEEGWCCMWRGKIRLLFSFAT